MENKIRNCRELGKNMQKIVKYLMGNDNLIKLLYYNETSDPLSQPNLTAEQKSTLIFNKLIKMVPRLDPQKTDKSQVAVMARQAKTLSGNSEFRTIEISIEIFVPLSQWIINNDNLRPYAIMGEIQESLADKNVNGLGRIRGGDFEYNFGTDEMSGFMQTFYITEYE